jgi:AcrR family transcriptional regulator
LHTAARLFYAEGIHRVGVDRVVSEAQVTRSTFYRHFPGKEELVLAYLQAAGDGIRAQVAATARPGHEPEARLRLIVDVLGDLLLAEGYRGCPFINAAAEYAEPDSPVRQLVLAYRTWCRETIVEVCTAAHHPEPDSAAQILLALLDGAAVAASLEDAETARAVFARTAHAVLFPERPGEARAT